MHAGELTIGNLAVGHIEPTSVTGKIGDFMARVFGCRHGELSRPFSRDGKAYVACLNCGARRHFNLGNWQMQGKFFYGKPAASN